MVCCWPPGASARRARPGSGLPTRCRLKEDPTKVGGEHVRRNTKPIALDSWAVVARSAMRRPCSRAVPCRTPPARCSTRSSACASTSQLGDVKAAERLFASAARYAAAEQACLGMNAALDARYAHWLGALLYNDPGQRAPAQALGRGHGGPPTLWSAGISGDSPIILLRLHTLDELPRVQEMLLAQRF